MLQVKSNVLIPAPRRGPSHSENLEELLSAVQSGVEFLQVEKRGLLLVLGLSDLCLLYNS